MTNIPIFLSSDNNYAPFVATTIASICDNTKSFCEFYILDGGISEENKEKISELKKQFSNFSIEFVNINYEIFAKFLTNSYITVAAYYRLIIPKLYPNINKFLYLDVDIIANGDIVELYNADLENFTIGAIEDVGNVYYIKRLKYNIEVSQKHIYFNSGVLLINNPKWNEQNISEKLFEIEEKYRGRLECNDQDLLNKYFENNYKQLPQKYNSKKIENDTIIRHFYHHIKPWNIHPNATLGSQLLPDFEIFWKYAKITPFYDELLKNCKYDTNHKVHIHLIYKKLDEQKKVTAVTIIIPIYNTGKYLKKCLDTVSNQNLLNIEIICINDASTDNSLEILEEYAKSDDRIKIVNFKENKGVAVARNTGMQLAKGQYIGFVDPDDYIDTDFCGKLYKKASETNADIVKGADITVLYPDGTKEIRPQNDSIKLNKLNFWVQFTTAIFKRDFLNKKNINFPCNMNVCEDIAFVTKAAILTNSIEIEPDVNYYYIRRDNSLDSNQYDADKVNSVINYVEEVSQLIEQNNLSIADKQLLLARVVSQIDQIRKYKVEKDSEDYKRLTKLYQQKVIEKMRLK